tara:strand:+ start:191 stop:1126 length:936 start_codon:yes stop_codon:yes gene_type:complete
LGLFDKFKKDKEEDRKFHEELDEKYGSKISSEELDFHNLLSEIQEDFETEPHRDESEIQNQLMQFLRGKGHEVEKEFRIDNESRIDLLVEGRFALEIKRAKSKTVLRNLSAQLEEYSESFSRICAVLILEDYSMMEMAEEYKTRYKERYNAETIILHGQKSGRKRTRRIDMGQTSRYYPRREPEEKKPSKLKKFLKGVDDFGKAVDQVSKALEPPPEKKRKRRSSSDEGLDYSKFFGSEEEKPKRKRRTTTAKKKTTKRKTRKKQDDDSYGMNFFGKPSKKDNAFGMDFFGTESKKKKRKKNDEDDWTFGF